MTTYWPRQPFLHAKHMAPGTGRSGRCSGHLQRPKPIWTPSPTGSHKENAKESPVFLQKPVLAKQFQENVSTYGPPNNGLGLFVVQRLWRL